MRVAFVAALEEETRALAAHVPVHHLGVGKVQAASALAALLRDEPADLVVNLGTAGGLHGQPLGTIVEIARVHQHDFDHEGAARFVGRPMPGGPIDLPGPDGARGRLATGDRLIASATARAALAADADVVDMEGYAIAAVARSMGRDVWLTKAVSDGAEDDVYGGWHQALSRCSEQLARWAEERGLLG